MNSSLYNNSPKPQKHPASIAQRRERTWGTLRFSMTFQSSAALCRIYEASPAEVVHTYLWAYGSFTTTAPAAFWHRSYLSLPDHSKLHGKQRDLDWVDDYNFGYTESVPLRFPCPLISRTFSMTSSLGQYPIDTSSSPYSTPKSLVAENASTIFHPVLKAVERASKLSYHTVCATCLKTGRSFPRCPRCGDMWCSRECRMQGGKRHVCGMRLPPLCIYSR
ncbi:hypothetical protein K503DRAFT_481999 [Rhizopogon vinicolor AM-OR11-026]|uniref:Uncharacterized protein n=1 Tax=Rhizopogon vinicolor AM-OR11-026 TaxID=1314800 RepID=A0A1B7N9M9_9AGAM|nr:hypothetical protein K503DRAFT_481999 [Rhizopogon vinicolor AM-OR11-026]